MQLAPEIQFYPAKCIGCGACVEVCVSNGHIIQDNVHVYVREICTLCGLCVDDCFSGALELTGERMTVDEVLAAVLADRVFYENSGGGVTLSGGEPTVQSAFTKALLERCKAEGLHTAIQTNGHCPWERLEALLPLVDLVMMDLKQLNSDDHRAATGAPNERVLDNAERLAQTDRPLWFRTPVIPTVNDTPEAIAEIAAYVRHLTDVRLSRNHRLGMNIALPSLELLRFHRLAGDKYRSLGLPDRVADLEPPSWEKMNDLRRLARSFGIEVIG